MHIIIKFWVNAVPLFLHFFSYSIFPLYKMSIELYSGSLLSFSDWFTILVGGGGGLFNLFCSLIFDFNVASLPNFLLNAQFLPSEEAPPLLRCW